MSTIPTKDTSGTDMENLLESMGVHKYDPTIVTALNEYANRVAGDLLCDARDYANHRSAGPDIDVSDAKLAIKLSSVFASKAVPFESAGHQVMSEVNKIPLSKSVNSNNFFIRYPDAPNPLVEVPDVVTGLMQRTYTLVPSTALTTLSKAATTAALETAAEMEAEMEIDNVPTVDGFTTMALNGDAKKEKSDNGKHLVAAAFTAPSE
jgi:hypothetical protein